MAAQVAVVTPYPHSAAPIYTVVMLEFLMQENCKVWRWEGSFWHDINVQFNTLMPNGHCSGRTALLISRRCILNIYSTNIRTEYFRHAA
jgi:hypothetical protein